jgi:hypothetical protein
LPTYLEINNTFLGVQVIASRFIDNSSKEKAHRV